MWRESGRAFRTIVNVNTRKCFINRAEQFVWRVVVYREMDDESREHCIQFAIADRSSVLQRSLAVRIKHGGLSKGNRTSMLDERREYTVGCE